jgi:hypothetical protein
MSSPGSHSIPADILGSPDPGNPGGFIRHNVTTRSIPSIYRNCCRHTRRTFDGVDVLERRRIRRM